MRVTGPTKLAGKYERSGALNGMPLYIGENGQRIWFDQGRGAVRACWEVRKRCCVPGGQGSEDLMIEFAGSASDSRLYGMVGAARLAFKKLNLRKKCGSRSLVAMPRAPVRFRQGMHMISTKWFLGGLHP